MQNRHNNQQAQQKIISTSAVFVANVLQQSSIKNHIYCAILLIVGLFYVVAFVPNSSNANNVSSDLDLNIFDKTILADISGIIKDFVVETPVDKDHSDNNSNQSNNSDDTNPDSNRILLPLTLNLESSEGSKNSQILNLLPPEEELWKDITVKKGENLALVFKRAGVSGDVIQELLKSSKKAKELKNIHPGQILSFLINKQNQLDKLKHTKGPLEGILYTRKNNSYTAQDLTRKPDVKYAYRKAEIKSSLFSAAQDASLSNSTTLELANLFGCDIDFALDLRDGDSFEILFEEKYLDDEKLDNGKILAAQFTNQKKTYSAVVYTDKSGNSNYYTLEGNSLKKGFIRTPLDFTRISSNFNLSRMHPILHTMRAHKGTDYAARTGTPVWSTADGKVTFAGNRSGYGNTIVIQHAQNYSTLYAHLNGYGKALRIGKEIKQGEIIGYVGSTGLATGPHLHYEFRVNGEVKNPLTVKLPNAPSISQSQRRDFLNQTRPLWEQMAEHRSRDQQPQFAGVSKKYKERNL